MRAKRAEIFLILDLENELVGLPEDSNSIMSTFVDLGQLQTRPWSREVTLKTDPGLGKST